MVDRPITHLELSAHVTLENEVDPKSHLLRMWALLSQGLCCPLWTVTDGRVLSSDGGEKRGMRAAFNYSGHLGKDTFSFPSFRKQEDLGHMETEPKPRRENKMNLTRLSGHLLLKTEGRLRP